MKKNKRTNRLNFKLWIIGFFSLVITSSLLFYSTSLRSSMTDTSKDTSQTRISSRDQKLETGETVSTTSELMGSESFVAASTTNTAEEVMEAEIVRLPDQALLENAAQVSYGVYSFQSGAEFSYEPSQSMVAASVIKIFIMDYLYETEVSSETVVAGETLGELVRRMIQISDNDATNKLIDYVGMDKLNAYFNEAGYWNTKLERKMLDEAARGQGFENWTSVADVMLFLKKIYEQQAQPKYAEMIQIMQGQQIHTKIQRYLAGEFVIANKTGELAGVENDVGIVFGSSPVIIAILTNGVYHSENMRHAIGHFSEIIVKNEIG